MQLLGPGVVVHQSLSKADGGIKRPAYTCSTVCLCVAAAAAPVRLQEHEVLRWHHSTGRIRGQRVEEVHTELEAVSECITCRGSLGKVREQRDVAVRVGVAVGECHRSSVYLARIYTAEILTDQTVGPYRVSNGEGMVDFETSKQTTRK